MQHVTYRIHTRWSRYDLLLYYRLPTDLHALFTSVLQGCFTATDWPPRLWTVRIILKKSDNVTTRSIVSQTSSRKTPHSSPVRARYGVSLVSINSYLCAASITAALYVISFYIGPRCNDTPQCFWSTACVVKWWTVPVHIWVPSQFQHCFRCSGPLHHLPSAAVV